MLRCVLVGKRSFFTVGISVKAERGSFVYVDDIDAVAVHQKGVETPVGVCFFKHLDSVDNPLPDGPAC